MEARLIKETVNSIRRKGISNLGDKTKHETPLIVIMTPSTNMLTIHGQNPISDYIYENKVPEGIDIIRLDSRINSGVILSGPSTVIVRIFCQSIDIIRLSEIFYSSVINVMSTNGINVRKSSHRYSSNDMVFIKDNKEKKFCGVVEDFKYGYFSFFFTFTFDSAIGENIYKLDSDKFKNRGLINNVTDVVGGLTEIAPTINDTVVNDVITYMCKKLSWEIVESTFTTEEENFINS